MSSLKENQNKQSKLVSSDEFLFSFLHNKLTRTHQLQHFRISYQLSRENKGHFSSCSELPRGFERRNQVCELIQLY